MPREGISKWSKNDMMVVADPESSGYNLVLVSISAHYVALLWVQ